MKTFHCDNCVNFSYNYGPVCAHGHAPRFSPPKGPDDVNYGYKRKCMSFKEIEIPSATGDESKNVMLPQVHALTDALSECLIAMNEGGWRAQAGACGKATAVLAAVKRVQDHNYHKQFPLFLNAAMSAIADRDA